MQSFQFLHRLQCDKHHNSFTGSVKAFCPISSFAILLTMAQALNARSCPEILHVPGFSSVSNVTRVWPHTHKIFLKKKCYNYTFCTLHLLVNAECIHGSLGMKIRLSQHYIMTSKMHFSDTEDRIKHERFIQSVRRC